MRKKVLSLVLASAMCASLAACGGSGSTEATTAAPGGEATTAANGDTEATSGSEDDTTAVETDGDLTAGGELIDGKFAETRHIKVEVYNRSNDGGTDPTTNMYAQYIKDGMLKDHNVEVEFVSVPRWTEVDEINNLLAAGDAPDICLTYDYPTIKTYANMGGVTDLSTYVEQYKAVTPHLWDWLGETNIYWDKDPIDGTLWAIEGKRAINDRINTFIRQDWLDKLGLKAPTTTQEFEEVIKAFRDNAETLLGDDKDKMVPYSVSADVGWRAATLFESFIDPDISDREFYVNGFDDRKLTQNGVKEGVRLLNTWYHENLMWNDFALYSQGGDTSEDDMMKAGYVGAFSHNWDYPFRNGEDSINANLQRIVGPDAKFVAIDPFQDKNGNHTKYIDSTAGDRKIFFPVTNTEPLASLLYLDWISDPEHIQYLQLGDEGVTHQVNEDGSYSLIAATGDPIMNSGNNIDYTITCNGLHLTDADLTIKSLAHSYASIDPELVENAHKIAQTDAVPVKNVNVGNIAAEEGMGTALSEKRNIMYDNCVICDPDKFDSEWDKYMADYLSSGGQAIMDERDEKWVATFGDVDTLPQ